MDIAEASRAPWVNAQTNNKVFNTLLKSHVFHDRVQEQRRKLNDEKTWANFKAHFSVEIKEHKTNKLA